MQVSISFIWEEIDAKEGKNYNATKGQTFSSTSWNKDSNNKVQGNRSKTGIPPTAV